MKATTQEWLNFAKEDILSCEKILQDDFLTRVVAFHAQQAVEKSFKAIIDYKGIKSIRVHNLFKLLAQIHDFIDFEIDMDKLAIIDSIYTESRYPGETGLMPYGKPTPEDAREMYEFASSIYQLIVKILEKH